MPGGTGCFEVKVIQGGKETLVHSKLTRGEGKVDAGNLSKLLSNVKDVVARAPLPIKEENVKDVVAKEPLPITELNVKDVVAKEPLPITEENVKDVVAKEPLPNTE